MQKRYRSIVGVFIFLVTTCRVDISYGVSMLAQYMSKPGHAHYKAAQYLLSYLSGTTNLGIAYYSTGNRKPYAYADADFGADESLVIPFYSYRDNYASPLHSGLHCIVSLAIATTIIHYQ